MNFAEISKELRNEYNLSQVELANKTGLSKACISMIEIGKNEPTAKTLIAYANFFKCSIDYLVGRENDFGNVIINNTSSVPTLTLDEKQLLDDFRKLDSITKYKVIGYCHALI